MISDSYDTIDVYVGAVESDDPQAALQSFWEQIDPEFTSSFAEVNVDDVTAVINKLFEVFAAK